VQCKFSIQQLALGAPEAHRCTAYRSAAACIFVKDKRWQDQHPARYGECLADEPFKNLPRDAEPLAYGPNQEKLRGAFCWLAPCRLRCMVAHALDLAALLAPGECWILQYNSA
jgi:hypothetical protein